MSRSDHYIHNTSYQMHFNAARRVVFPKGALSGEDNICGYRYQVRAICQCQYDGGPVDMSILKKIMNETLKVYFDYGLIIAYDDNTLHRFFDGDKLKNILTETEFSKGQAWYGRSEVGKIAIMPYPPISENLAKFFFEQLTNTLDQLQSIHCNLIKIKVWETPNWCSEYPVTK